MISYKWDNQNLAKQVEQRLKRDGHQTWIDVTDMASDIPRASAAGQPEHTAITHSRKTLCSDVKFVRCGTAARSSKAVIAFITPKYMDSDACKTEVFAALDHEPAIPFIPIRIIISKAKWSYSEAFSNRIQALLYHNVDLDSDSGVLSEQGLSELIAFIHRYLRT